MSFRRLLEPSIQRLQFCYLREDETLLFWELSHIDKFHIHKIRDGRPILWYRPDNFSTCNLWKLRVLRFSFISQPFWITSAKKTSKSVQSWFFKSIKLLTVPAMPPQRYNKITLTVIIQSANTLVISRYFVLQFKNHRHFHRDRNTLCLNNLVCNHFGTGR